ncbi:MAG: hypothetical protein NVSMB27_49250 [Ktedonobacteraceae bacterium]
MKSFFIQRNTFLLLLGIIVIVSASLVFLFTAGNTLLQPAVVTPTPNPIYTPLAKLSQAPPVKPCNAKQRDFQAGIAFPQWGPTAYGENDTKWLTELPQMRAQTAACWVEMPVLLYQASLSSTTVMQGPSTPSVSSFNYGVHLAHALGLHIYVTPLLQVNGAQPWAGAIKFAFYAQEQQWFESYWQAIKPYAVTAAQAGVEQFALGTEYDWLQENAPDSLWNGLIANVRSVFPGTLTYDTNWDVLQKQPPAWMRNPELKMIGVSAYLPVVDTPERVDPKQIFSLWQQTVKRALDNFAIALGEPIFISEIGYRNSADALYRSWETTSSAPPDPEEQAAACDAALANIIPDQHILGSFFWGWDDTEAFNLNGMQAASVIHSYYQALQA